MTEKDYPKIEVIEADVTDPSRKLNWTVTIEHGTPIYDSVEALQDDMPITEAPPEGTEVLVNALFGWERATVTSRGAESKSFLHLIEFDEKRKYWVSTAMINKKCLPQLLKLCETFSP